MDLFYRVGSKLELELSAHCVTWSIIALKRYPILHTLLEKFNKNSLHGAHANMYNGLFLPKVPGSKISYKSNKNYRNMVYECIFRTNSHFT